MVEAAAPPDLAGRALDVWVLSEVSDILRVVVDPELRAAALEALATIDFDNVERHADGSVTFTITHGEAPRVRETMTIDADGWLVSESREYLDPYPDLGLPANQRTFHATYEPPQVVESLPAD